MRMPLAFFLAAMFIVSVDALRAVSQPVTTFTRRPVSGTLSAVDRCAALRQAAISAAQRRAESVAGAVAREFGLALDRHLRDDAHPLSQAPDADEIGSTPAASTYCAGSSSPRTVFAALDLSSYHAVHAGAARDAVTVDDATVLPSTDHGEANTIPASVSGRPWRHITIASK